MKKPAIWALILLISFISDSLALAGPVVEVKQGGTNVNVSGVPVGAPTIDNNGPAAPGNSQMPDIGSKEIAPGPAFQPTGPAAAVRPVSAATPGAPAAAATPAPAKAAPAIQTARPSPKPSLTQSVAIEVEKNKKDPYADWRPFFDNLLKPHAGTSAQADVRGKAMAAPKEIEHAVRLADDSRDPAFYRDAIGKAEKAYPEDSRPGVARQIKDKILEEHAMKRAEPELVVDLSDAYQKAAVGDAKGTSQAVSKVKKWQELFEGSQFDPLVFNIGWIENHLGLILEEGRRTPLSQPEAAKLSVSIEHSGLSLIVLPPVMKISPAVIARMAVADASAISPGLSPWSVFRTLREAGVSRTESAQASLSYSRVWIGQAVRGSQTMLRNSWARIWHAVRNFALRLVGRGHVEDVSRGFSITAQTALLEKGEGESLREGVEARRSASSAPAWWADRFAAMTEFEDNAARVKSQLSRPAQTIEPALKQSAQAMAAAWGRLTGDGMTLAFVTEMFRRVEADPRLVQKLVLGPESFLRPLVGNMEPSARGFMLGLPGRARANVLLSRKDGQRLALVDLGRQSGSGLRAVAKALLDAPQAPEGSFVVMGDQIVARWTKDGRSVKIYANLGDSGAAVLILVEEAQDLLRVADRLSRIGFSVTKRAGRDELAASWPKSSGVEQAYSQALRALQFGAPSPADQTAADSGVARLADEVKNHRSQELARMLRSRMLEDLHVVGRIRGVDVLAGSLRGAGGRNVSIRVLADWSAARAESDGQPLTVADLPK